MLLSRVREEILEIDTWIMSCRVLKRGVEQFLLNHLLLAAKAKGLKAIQGEYIPTAKNELVRDHYSGLGFENIGNGNNGRTSWELRLTEVTRPLSHYIKETNSL